MWVLSLFCTFTSPPWGVTVTWAELAVDTDRETGGRGTPRSEEERSEDEELLQSTSEYIDSLLMEYRVVDVAQ